MSKSQPSLGSNQALDVERLIETRLLLQANSGAGKSWCLRRLAEQTYGHCQQIIIDPDGEFHTLREQHDYVLAGKNGDCPADVKSAGLLARRLLELGVSAIIDIYELGAQRRLFVQKFLEAMMDAPRDLWHPVLVIIDEAHMFCPEKGNAESTAAVIDLMSRGRKRGFCGVLATQRISKLHKDACAETNNKLIGRAALDIDMKRAADELGFHSREEVNSLRKLENGHFYAFGPALTPEVCEIVIGPVKTTHLRAGQRGTRVTPPRDRVKKILAQLADLPQEAAEEAKTVAELRARVRDLEATLVRANAAKPAAKTEIKTVPVLTEADFKRVDHLWGKIADLAAKSAETFTSAVEATYALRGTVAAARTAFDASTPKPTAPAAQRLVHPVGAYTAPSPKERAQAKIVVAAATRAAIAAEGDLDLGNAELKILEACAWMESIGHTQGDATTIAFLAGYTVNGHFNNMRGKLRSGGYITYPSGGKIQLTDLGRAKAPPIATPRTLDALHAAVKARVDDTLWRLLAPLIDAYPEAYTADVLAEAAGYTINGHFNNMRGRLRSLGLVTYPEKNHVRAADLLFPAGLV